MKEYFIIYFGEDGVEVSQADRAQVEKLITRITTDREHEHDSPFVADIPPGGFSTEGNYPAYRYLIIKGGVVVPRPVEVIRKYEF